MLFSLQFLLLASPFLAIATAIAPGPPIAIPLSKRASLQAQNGVANLPAIRAQAKRTIAYAYVLLVFAMCAYFVPSSRSQQAAEWFHHF